MNKLRVKQAQVEHSIARRHERGQNGLSLTATVFVSACIVVAHVSGIYIGLNNAAGPLAAATTNEEVMDTFNIGNYTIYMETPSHPEMADDTIGYTYNGVDGDIHIETGWGPTETYEICAHEHLHNLGISSDNHQWVYEFEDQLVDPVCLKLLYRLTPESEYTKVTP